MNTEDQDRKLAKDHADWMIQLVSSAMPMLHYLLVEYMFHGIKHGREADDKKKR